MARVLDLALGRGVTRAAFALAVLLFCGGASAEVAPDLLRAVFPSADRAGPVTGSPPAARVTAAGAPIGWLLYTDEVVGSVGYAGKPMRI
ncbi:MAG: hypothetical protein WD673_16945, partial [Alphaproteobacteria bacterium]